MEARKSGPLDDRATWIEGSDAMGKLKLQMQVSIDSSDANGPSEDGAWDEIEGYSRDLLDSADTIILGRKTAVDFIPYWDDAAAQPEGPWQGVAQRISAASKVVFSKTLDKPDWKNSRIENGDLAEGIKRLKATKKKDILVYGGVSFVTSLIEERLIDEFHLFVNPVAIGKGKSIFSGLGASQPFKLVKSIAYNSGIVLLHYEPK
jgi:dihydrofolate reductase